MELLLLEDVSGLGRQGEIVTVARGYARNYLLPKNLAKAPTAKAIEEVQARAEKTRVVKEADKAEQMDIAKKLATVSLTIPMKASEAGSLYGSVGPRHVLEALVAVGYELEEKQVNLDPHLKAVGEYDVSISLHPEVQVPVKVVITAEEEG